MSKQEKKRENRIAHEVQRLFQHKDLVAVMVGLVEILSDGQAQTLIEACENRRMFLSYNERKQRTTHRARCYSNRNR